MDLVKKFNCTLHLPYNAGSVNVSVSYANTITQGYSLTSANNTFTNLFLHNISGGILANTASIILHRVLFVHLLKILKPKNKMRVRV